VGWARHVTHMREKRTAYTAEFWSGNVKETGSIDDLGVGGGNIKGDLVLIGCQGVERSHLAQDRDKLWSFANKAMYLQVPYNAEHFIMSRRTFRP